jgi:hypothetical protein
MAASISRQELYDLVWSEPLTKLAVKFDVTPSQLKTICIEFEIPLPKNGYWSKLKFNKEVEIFALKPFAKKVVSFAEYRKVKIKQPAMHEPPFLSTTIQKELATKKLKSKMVEVYTIDHSPKNKNNKETNISVSIDKILNVSSESGEHKRALNFANCFYKNFIKRGHKIVFVENHRFYNYNGRKFVVFGEMYDLFLREVNNRTMVKHTKYSWESATYTPSGKLCLKLDNWHYKEWSDSKTKPLVTKVHDIIDFLEKRAKQDIQDRIDREISRENRRLKEIEEARAAKIKAKDVSDFKLLINSSGRWHKSQQLRNYLSTYEDRMKSNGELTKELMDWLDWARKKADWYDPFMEAEDDIFQDVDRDSF